MNNTPVFLQPCSDYDSDTVSAAFSALFADPSLLDWVRPGMRIALKVNLVVPHSPDSAATVHPAVVCELCRRLIARGASVIVGDSPGGLFTPAALKLVYARTGMNAVTQTGAELNYDCSETSVFCTSAKTARHFEYTSWIRNADAVVNVCKLKTHGFLTMSGAVKNLFGIIPGTKKPEYHYLYPDTRVFADMLVDLCEFAKPILSVMDAVVGMEGNGPTAGTPRKMGVLLASRSPYTLDLVAGSLIGVQSAPLFDAAFERGLAPKDVSEVACSEAYEKYVLSDWDVVPVRKIELIVTRSSLMNRLAKAALRRKPVLSPKLCVQCGLCAKTCPVHAITMAPKPHFDRKTCITCFCCQEFCPKSAIKVKMSPVSKLLGH